MKLKFTLMTSLLLANVYAAADDSSPPPSLLQTREPSATASAASLTAAHRVPGSTSERDPLSDSFDEFVRQMGQEGRMGIVQPGGDINVVFMPFEGFLNQETLISESGSKDEVEKSIRRVEYYSENNEDLNEEQKKQLIQLRFILRMALFRFGNLS